MTLINNADPYQAGPLPDSSEDIAHLIEDTVGGGKFAKEMASLSGTWYSKFVHEINTVKEQKDSDLAQIMVCFLIIYLVHMAFGCCGASNFPSVYCLY